MIGLLGAACGFSVAYAQQDESDGIFDDATPSVQDSLPPGVSEAAIQRVEQSNEQSFALQDKTALLTQTPQKVSEMMQPFNSMRIKLILNLQKNPNSVTVANQRIRLHHPERVATFYRQEQFPTIWTQEHQFTAQLPALQKLIAESYMDGLNPNRYHADIIQSLQQGQDYDDILDYELLLSDAYLTLMGDLANGLVNPRVTQPEWNAPAVKDDVLAGLFAQGIIQHDIVKAVHDINDNDPRYQMLKRAYVTLLDQQSLLGQSNELTNQLNNLAINMERVRWMPQSLGDSYILVNIPAFQVEMLRDGVPVYQAKTIVGKPSRPTPAFINHVQHIVMAPTWTVPPTIMQKDKLPRLRKNPAAFDGSFEVITPGGQRVAPSSIDWSNGSAGYTLRQKSGARNALGRIKFLFPNRHAIYLHDTPSKSLFKRKTRAYSSGCVRIENPLELANVLLQGTQWTPQSIKAATRGSGERWVDPAQQIPIYLVYWTTWLNSQGHVETLRDIYHHDKPLLTQYLKALNQFNQ